LRCRATGRYTTASGRRCCAPANSGWSRTFSREKSGADLRVPRRPDVWVGPDSRRCLAATRKKSPSRRPFSRPLPAFGDFSQAQPLEKSLRC
jgi:hypothetical protein